MTNYEFKAKIIEFLIQEIVPKKILVAVDQLLEEGARIEELSMDIHLYLYEIQFKLIFDDYLLRYCIFINFDNKERNLILEGCKIQTRDYKDISNLTNDIA